MVLRLVGGLLLLLAQGARADIRVRFDVVTEDGPGSFVVRTRDLWAPIGCARFRELVDQRFYDDTRFFRVVPGFMVQFGLSGDPAVAREWSTNRIMDDKARGVSNKRGYMTFATSGSNSRTTQLFINYVHNGNLDGWSDARRAGQRGGGHCGGVRRRSPEPRRSVLCTPKQRRHSGTTSHSASPTGPRPPRRTIATHTPSSPPTVVVPCHTSPPLTRPAAHRLASASIGAPWRAAHRPAPRLRRRSAVPCSRARARAVARPRVHAVRRGRGRRHGRRRRDLFGQPRGPGAAEDRQAGQRVPRRGLRGWSCRPSSSVVVVRCRGASLSSSASSVVTRRRPRCRAPSPRSPAVVRRDGVVSASSRLSPSESEEDRRRRFGVIRNSTRSCARA